jgi:DNA-binding FrmR family transcriptional regulator
MSFRAQAARRASQEAEERRAAGHSVHSVLVELDSARAGSAHDLSDVVEQVEAVGWRLDRVESAVVAAHARPMILLLFRPA